ncbi:MAG TPA: IS1595 family transposase [Roseiarcus sp.]|nr:IS1595 family transposase [Roseiarcus sp.]
MPSLKDPIFCAEYPARRYIETMRWPDGPACTKCQSPNVIRMGGQTQAGMLLCRECRGKFTCRMGTSMEHSHVPLHKWLLALYLATDGERYLSPQRLMRQLNLGSYRTAWLMAQRIREALSQRRRELDRQGCRRDPISPSPNRVGLASGCGEKTRVSFDDAVKAMIASRPMPSAPAKREGRGLNAPAHGSLVSAGPPTCRSAVAPSRVADMTALSSYGQLGLDATRTLSAISASQFLEDHSG